MVNLKNKVALVTGATSGLGQAIAVELLNHGCNVILTGRNPKKIENSILNQKQYKNQITFISSDLGTDKGLNHLVNEINKVYQKIDILIHSAGTIYLGSTALTSIEKFDEQYKINVRAPYFLTRAFLKTIIDNKGQIVFINSTAGLDSWAGVGQYSATKHALRAWVNSLRLELSGLGVKIINIFPGATDSPMQHYVQKFEQQEYDAKKFIPTSQLADIVVKALKVPDITVVSDIVVKPLGAGTKPGFDRKL